MVNLQSNESVEILPTFSAEEFEFKVMTEQLRIERELKKQAVARLLKEDLSENENTRATPDEMDEAQLNELVAMIPEDNGCQDLAVDTPPSFQDLIDFAERRQDDECHHDMSLKLDNDDEQWISYVESDLTCDSYEKAYEQAYQMQLQNHDATDMATARERVTVYSNHPRHQEKELPVEEQSIGSLQMFVNHLTCSAQDTVTWGDWKTWVY
ncbi:MAG: hypothetical protein SGILL_000182 [Bacillariaceae sp.]